jgi:hypothetical protein
MKKLKALAMVAMASLVTFSAQRSTASDLYSGHEGSLDLYGFYGSRDKSGHGDAFGPGVGFNYFFSQYWGAGADTYADAFNTPYLLNGSVIFRYPIGETRFAPYGFAGFGRQWEHAAQWTGHLGVGGEYRFNHRTGFFADIRQVFPDNTTDYTVFRFGFRIKFM